MRASVRVLLWQCDLLLKLYSLLTAERYILKNSQRTRGIYDRENRRKYTCSGQTTAVEALINALPTTVQLQRVSVYLFYCFHLCQNYNFSQYMHSRAFSAVFFFFDKNSNHLMHCSDLLVRHIAALTSVFVMSQISETNRNNLRNSEKKFRNDSEIIFTFWPQCSSYGIMISNALILYTLHTWK